MSEMIHPDIVPKRRLYTAEEIPGIGSELLALINIALKKWQTRVWGNQNRAG